jgi:hypothetical protein
MILNLLLPTQPTPLMCVMSRNGREPPSHRPAINHNISKSPAFRLKKFAKKVYLNGKFSFFQSSNARKMFHTAILAFILISTWICMFSDVWKTRRKRERNKRERDRKKELKQFLCVSMFLLFLLFRVIDKKSLHEFK